MKKRILISIVLLVNILYVFPCTTFKLQTQNELIFGRNLDWVSDNGLIIQNQRNIHKVALTFPPDKPMEWTSKYGSITFNQFGKEFPFGGINEKGLVVEIMNASAQYPKPDSRAAINESQWIQYQLDNAATIDEVIASDKFLRISYIKQELHFLICDSNGNTAVIEFINNKMVVYKDANLPIPVLENSSYSKSLDNYKNNKTCRFGTAAKMISNYKPINDKSIIDYSFSILDSVALNKVWSIVYDIKNMKIHFKTAWNRSEQIIDIKKFDFNCNTTSVMYDLHSTNASEITQLFIPFNSKINKNIMEDAFRTNTILLPDAILNKLYDYHTECECVK